MKIQSKEKKESKKLLGLIIETLYGTGIITKTHIHPIGSGGKPLKKRKKEKGETDLTYPNTQSICPKVNMRWELRFYIPSVSLNFHVPLTTWASQF